MGLWAHHLAVELYGKEYSPETPMEHVMVFGITGLALVLMIYGAWAAIRDLARWRRSRAARAG